MCPTRFSRNHLPFLNSVDMSCFHKLFFLFYRFLKIFFWCGPFFKVFIEFVTIFFLFFMFWLFGHKGYGTSAPGPGIEPQPPTLGGAVLTTGLTGKSLTIMFCKGHFAKGRYGWMASPTQRTWIWANSRRSWRTAKPGRPQTMRLQGVKHNLATEQQKVCCPLWGSQ